MATRTSQDNIQVVVTLDGSRAGTSLKELKAEVRALSKELEALPADTEEFAKKLDELAKKEAALAKATDQVKAARAAARKDATESEGIFKSIWTSTQTGFRALTGDAKAMESVMGGLKTSVKGLAGAFLPLLAVQGAFDFITSSVSAFNESAEAAARLENALQGNTAAIERMNAQAEQLSQQSLFDDDAITNAQAQLALYTDNADAIERLMPLIIDLSAAKGMDLKTATDQVGKALAGEAGELKALGLEFEKNATAADRLAAVQALLQDKVGGAGKAAAESGTGPWTVLGNKFGNLMESIGGIVVSIGNALVPALTVVVDAITPVVDAISTMVGWFSDATGAIGDFYNGVIDYFTTTNEEVARDYRKMTDEQRAAFEANAASMGISMDEIKAKVKELEEAEAAAAAETVRVWGQKYASMDVVSQKFYGTLLKFFGNSEETLTNIQIEAERVRAEQSQRAQAEARAEADKKQKEWYEKNKSRLEQQAREEIEAARAIARLQAEVITNEKERELALLALKEQEALAGVRGTEDQQAQQRLLLQERYEQERLAIIKKYRDQENAAAVKAAEEEARRVRELLELQDKEAAAMAAAEMERREQWLDDKLAALDAAQDRERAAIQENVTWQFTTESELLRRMYEQEQQFLEQRILAISQSGLDEVAQRELINQAVEESDKRSAERRLEIERDAASRRKEVMQATMQLGEMAIGQIFAAEKANNEALKAEQLKQVDQFYAIRLAGAKGNAAATARVEREQAAARKRIEKEAFDRQKEYSEKQALINGALAITRILADVPKVDFGVATALQIAFAIATTTAQVADIRRQKFERGGVVGGPSHAQGGVKLVNSVTGQIEGEMEGGEPYMILSKNTYRNNRGVIDRLLHNSMYRDGAPIFERGGIFTPNVPTIVGGAQNDTAALAAEMRALRADVSRWNSVLRAYVVYQDMLDADDELSTIQSSTQLT